MGKVIKSGSDDSKKNDGDNGDGDVSHSSSSCPTAPGEVATIWG